MKESSLKTTVTRKREALRKNNYSRAKKSSNLDLICDGRTSNFQAKQFDAS